MPDEVKKRLQDSADKCIKSYEAWSKNKKDGAASEALQDAVHEIRKVASRLEIELAASERDESTQKPIPIPPHRDAGGRHQSADSGEEDSGNKKAKPKSSGKKSAPKKASGGDS